MPPARHLRLWFALLLLLGVARAQEPPREPQDTLPPAPSATTPPPPEAMPGSLSELARDLREAVAAQPACDFRRHDCRLTPQQKFQLFVNRTYSPYTFVNAALDTTYSHLTHEAFGPGWEGAARRYGATLADGEARSLMQTYVLSSLFRQDPRYHRLGRGNALYRMAYAGSRVLVGRTDDGRSAFNSPEMIGAFAGSALSNLYYPDRRRGLDHTLSRFIGGLGSDAGTHLLREFWPDIKRWFGRHEPQSLQKIGEGTIPRPAPAKSRDP